MRHTHRRFRELRQAHPLCEVYRSGDVQYLYYVSDPMRETEVVYNLPSVARYCIPAPTVMFHLLLFALVRRSMSAPRKAVDAEAVPLSADDVTVLEFQLRQARRKLRQAQTELHAVGTAGATSSGHLPAHDCTWWQSPLAAVIVIALLLNLPRIYNIYTMLVAG